MDKNICNTVLKQRERFIPLLFTSKQVNLLDRYLNQKSLTNSEKVIIYSVIKRKIEALSLLKEEFYINGGEMISPRVESAKKILKELGEEKAFVSGSFLFKNNYGDIDIYILGRRRKESHQGKKHFIWITEEDLKKPIFYSAFRYSLSNFSIGEPKLTIQKPKFDDLNLTYQMAINEVLDKSDNKALREIIFAYDLYLFNRILDSFSLFKKIQEMKRLKDSDQIDKINLMAKQIILALYSKRYLYDYLCHFLKGLKKDLVNEHYKNLLIFSEFFEEVKNECRRIETKN